MIPADPALIDARPDCLHCGHPEDSHVAPGVCAERVGDGMSPFCCCEGYLKPAPPTPERKAEWAASKPCDHFEGHLVLTGLCIHCGWLGSRHPQKPATKHVLSIVDKLPKPEFKWSPVQMLEELLADIKAGKMVPKNLMIFFMEEIDGGKSLKPVTYSANCSYAETIAFCELEKARALDEWRKG